METQEKLKSLIIRAEEIAINVKEDSTVDEIKKAQDDISLILEQMQKIFAE